MFKKSIFFTLNPAQTKKAGGFLAEEILKSRPDKKAAVVALSGELGSGKTTFLQGFAKKLGIKQRILSPTFVIMRSFKIPKSGQRSFFHIDCYRTAGSKDILVLGFKEIINDPNNIIAVEWADKILDILPENAIILKFGHIDSNKRRIECSLKKR